MFTLDVYEWSKSVPREIFIVLTTLASHNQIPMANFILQFLCITRNFDEVYINQASNLVILWLQGYGM